MRRTECASTAAATNQAIAMATKPTSPKVILETPLGPVPISRELLAEYMQLAEKLDTRSRVEGRTSVKAGILVCEGRMRKK